MSTDSPANAEPLLLAADENAYRISENPCAPGLSTPARPACAITAIAVPASTSNGTARIAIATIFISAMPIFLPRYSGVRPIINPAMNTARTAKISIPYRPEPTPPNTTSPSWIRNRGAPPASGIRLSCIALTAPQLADVVIVANSIEATVPKRVSMPSMLGPETPRCAINGFGTDCATTPPAYIATNRTVIAASTAMPWRRSPTIRPNANTSAAGISRIASISMKLVSGDGFSNGCDELALKKPPPLVPSSLMASCDATGPNAIRCVVVVTSCMRGAPCASRMAWPEASVSGT